MPQKILNDKTLPVDLYHLTMAQSWFLENYAPYVTFELFFRQGMSQNQHLILLAGMDAVLESIPTLTFLSEDIDYLRTLGIFQEAFLTYLHQFRFRGNIFSIPEGEVVFSYEPIMSIQGNLIEVQLLESFLMNQISYASSVATQAIRIHQVSGSIPFVELGLRRGFGAEGALLATRAAYIGGAVGTSFVEAGKRFQIPVYGSISHSFVQSFATEKEAFQLLLSHSPEQATLLIDTYHVLTSGLVHAIEVFQEYLQKDPTYRERALWAVRIDSGDLSSLSKQIRKTLDEADLSFVKIVVSNQIHPEVILELIRSQSPIDFFGIGTHLVRPPLDTDLVFKMVSKCSERRDGNSEIPVLKISENVQKSTLPGRKKVLRAWNAENQPLGDIIILESEYEEVLNIMQEHQSISLRHPVEHRLISIQHIHSVTLLGQERLREGRLVENDFTPLDQVRARSLQNWGAFAEEFRRILNPQVYQVGISCALYELTLKLWKEKNIPR